ncbi:MAG: MFS transporter, partial [Ktedonobacteraceae bacterium]
MSTNKQEYATSSGLDPPERGKHAGSQRIHNLTKFLALWVANAMYAVASLLIIVVLMKVLQFLSNNKPEHVRSFEQHLPRNSRKAGSWWMGNLLKRSTLWVSKVLRTIASFLIALFLIVAFQIMSTQKQEHLRFSKWNLLRKGADVASIRGASAPLPATFEETGSFRAVLTNLPFVLIWIAQLISQIAFNAGNYGLITIVTKVTGSAIMVGISMVCFTLPAIPASLLAGVYVDYLNKRGVLWITNVLRAVLSFLTVLALIFYPSKVIFLFALTVLNSIVAQFFMPAEAASIPMLVGKTNLLQALSLFNITLDIAQAIGFLVLGRVIESLFKTFTLPLHVITLTVTPEDMLYVVITVSYLICTVLILAIPNSKLQAVEHREGKLPKAPGKEMWRIVERDILGAWRFVHHDKRLLISILQVSFVTILLLIIGELAGPFVQNVLHLPVDDLTLLFAPAGVGLILGGILMPPLTHSLGKDLSITLGGLLTVVALIVMPLSQTQMATTHFSLTNNWSLIIVGLMSFVLGVALDM